MRHLTLCKSIGLFLMTAVLFAACDRLDPNVALTRALVYGQGYVYSQAESGYVVKDLLFDLMEPTDSPEAERPALILVHGGSFTGGGRENENLVVLANQLAGAGYVCFLIDYRLIDEEPPAPPPFDETTLETAIHAATVDVKAAIRHVRANAAEYAVDPNRIAVIGDSAGAMAAIPAGISPQGKYASDGDAFPQPASNYPDVDESVRAIVDLWGNADLFLDEFDPADPPFMVVHGARDFSVGISLLPAETIIEQCRTNAIPYRYYPVLDGGHGIWDIEVNGKDLAGLIQDFLQEFMNF